VTYYKVVNHDMKACHGGDYTYRMNRWTRRIADTDACSRGYHICTAEQLARWLYADSRGCIVLTVEAEGVTDAGDKCVAERIKPVRKVVLDEVDLRWLATEAAITCLHNTDDERVQYAIQTVREWCFGLGDGLKAAESAAWSAARSAAESAAWSAAWSAARSAARYAAESAAWSAAWSATESAIGRVYADYIVNEEVNS